MRCRVLVVIFVLAFANTLSSGQTAQPRGAGTQGKGEQVKNPLLIQKPSKEEAPGNNGGFQTDPVKGQDGGGVGQDSKSYGPAGAGDEAESNGTSSKQPARVAPVTPGALPTLGYVQVALGVVSLVLLILVARNVSDSLQKLTKVANKTDSMEERLQAWSAPRLPEPRPDFPRPAPNQLPDVSALKAELTRLQAENRELNAKYQASAVENHQLKEQQFRTSSELQGKIAESGRQAQIAVVPQFTSLDQSLRELTALSASSNGFRKALSREAERVKYALEQVRKSRNVTIGDATNLSARRAYWTPTDPESAGLSVLLDYCRERALQEASRLVGSSVVAPEQGEVFNAELHVEDGEAVPPSPEMAGKVAQCRFIGFERLVKARVQRYGRFEQQQSSSPAMAQLAPTTSPSEPVRSEPSQPSVGQPSVPTWTPTQDSKEVESTEGGDLSLESIEQRKSNETL